MSGNLSAPTHWTLVPFTSAPSSAIAWSSDPPPHMQLTKIAQVHARQVTKLIRQEFRLPSQSPAIGEVIKL